MAGERLMSDVQWFDKLAIQELIFRYSDSINRGDLAATESVFAADAIWESPLFNMHFETSREFCEFLAANSGGIDLLIQTPHCPVITFADADHATVTTTIYELSCGRVTNDGNPFGPIGTELNMEDFGIYYDTVERIDGHWLFTHRVFVPMYVNQGAATGDVTSARATLRDFPASSPT
jgi:hypothetical protein